MAIRGHLEKRRAGRKRERLVGTVEASNGIVYVHSGRCRGGVVACLPIWMTMYFFYRRYAPTNRDRFETLDATYAGIDVERELREWRREVSPCSALPAAPDSNKVNAGPAEWATGKDPIVSELLLTN